MSRIGRQPIPVPTGVNIAIDPGRIMVNGPLGELTQQVPVRIKVERQDDALVVTRPTDRGDDRALHGLTRSLIANMVEGVTKGFQKRLEIQGVGYRASLRGTSLELNVGYSHSVVIEPPLGITFEVPVPTQVLVKGVDKQQVGEVAAKVRKVRRPEPYKGKGIRYEGEYVRRKVGKRAYWPPSRNPRRARAGTSAFAARSPARPSVLVWSSSARTRASRRSSSTTSPARRSPGRRGCR
jgi:large subunit ribosomal protein L6